MIKKCVGLLVMLLPIFVGAQSTVDTIPLARNSVFSISKQPIYFEKGSDVEAGEAILRTAMVKMLHEVQEKYPDSHQGQRWAPVRLGGTAPAPLN